MNTAATALRVLIIEDSDDDAVLLLRELKWARFDPQWQQVQTADELEKALQSQPWDVVLSDYKLSHFSAPAALDLLKQSGQDIPFIVVSGTVGEATAVALMRAGACDYVMKDNLSRLGEAVRREIRDAQDRREHQQAQTDLERTCELLQLAIEGSGIGLWNWHIPSGAMWINDQCLHLLGYGGHPHPPTTIQDWQQAIHPQDRPRYDESLAAHVAGRCPTHDCEIRLRHRQGYWVWVLNRGRVVEWDADGQPLRVSGTLTDITERKQAEEERHQAAAQILHNSLHDALTGLPNRTFLKQRLELALQRSRRYPQAQFAVLFLDLDHFKVINDSLGHLAGDAILVTVAHTLQAMVRASDMAARLGGDEFVLLLEDIASLQEVKAMAERLLAELQQPFMVQGRKVFLNASLGIVTSLAHYQDASEPLRDADIAMYRAKARGRGCFVIFDASMRQQVLDRLQLEQDLRQAIDHQELVLYYQPILRLATGQICGFEVLVRWHHPQRGLLLPVEFIPIAEETGLIASLDRWVLDKGLQQLATWQRHYPNFAHLTLSFNVSSQDLWRDDLIPHLQALFAQSALSPCCLNLEIPESMLIQNIQAMALQLQQLRDLGLSLTIDDFGTGYSSLSYLHQLPVSALKIDRTFVSTMEAHGPSANIVETLITLSNRLGLEAVAEGVETQAQNQHLKHLGCELAQGHWFTHPLPAAAAERWLMAS
ncbi:two-component system response regulator [Leptolyngbya sp. BL0902]|uniref:putative bifunctional diguanylate cyclase/phosphodiesterase n=1 Tax=Leptolyngbya sp. BL0902 TaxID=1115757 RepID=UPI0018E830F0|nr:EAL domain-containing protein [Leptolyngbya sp. BL0902]QQE63652.1 two-component system response regulator [Leptolyngbya sp. BL0902]